MLRLTCPQQTPAPHAAEPGAETISPLPAWALRAAPEEPLPPRPLRPSHPQDTAQPPVISPLLAEQRFRRGRLIHRLLQELPELPVAARDAAARRWLARPTHGLDAAEQAEIAAEVAAVLNHPLLAPLFGPDGRAEVPLSGEIGGRLIAGQIDRLVLGPDAVTVLDLKSDRPPPRSPDAVHPAYLQQMAAYRALLRAIYPDRQVQLPAAVDADAFGNAARRRAARPLGAVTREACGLSETLAFWPQARAGRWLDPASLAPYIPGTPLFGRDLAHLHRSLSGAPRCRRTSPTTLSPPTS